MLNQEIDEVLLVEVLTLGNLYCERSSDQMGGGHFNARSLCGYLSHTSSAHIESLHIFTVLRLSHGLEGDTVDRLETSYRKRGTRSQDRFTQPVHATVHPANASLTAERSLGKIDLSQ